jgi:hypothetical protein
MRRMNGKQIGIVEREQQRVFASHTASKMRVNHGRFGYAAAMPRANRLQVRKSWELGSVIGCWTRIGCVGGSVWRTCPMSSPQRRYGSQRDRAANSRNSSQAANISCPCSRFWLRLRLSLRTVPPLRWALGPAKGMTPCVPASDLPFWRWPPILLGMVSAPDELHEAPARVPAPPELIEQATGLLRTFPECF